MPTTNHAATTAGKNPKTAPEQRLSKDGKWRYFPKVPCLRQYVPTGPYFARIKFGGKSIRKTLETNVFSVAKLRLPDTLKELRKPPVATGTFAQARALYETELANDHTLSVGTQKYRRDCLKVLAKTWPGLAELDISKISVKGCRDWASRFSAAGYSVQYFNNTLSTFKRIVTIGGLRGENNPLSEIKRLGVKPNELTLPDREQFQQIVKTIEAAGSRHSRHCADLVQFLAYSGCRISEARQVLWDDVDFKRGEIRVRNAKRSKRSSHHALRYVPINPDMLRLLLRLRQERLQFKEALARLEPHLAERVCLVGECEKSLTSACKKTAAPRITHHDLRHMFATLCIESGIDIPTISRWLGHSDGGALCMKTYGHLQHEHSAAMASKFTSAPVQNLLQLRAEEAV
jgi:integrase